MIYLILVSILWSFSFGIIKYGLGDVNPILLSFLRNLIAFVFFAFLTIYNYKKFVFDIKLIAIGGVQFGLMYIFYISSYQFLPAYLIATFTITTPIFIMIFSQIINHKPFTLNGIYSVLFVITGSYLIRLTVVNPFDYWIGFILIQFANLFFALGQLLFKEWKSKNKQTDVINNFSQLFFGAVIITFIFNSFYSNSFETINSHHIPWLLFLGLISTGLGFLVWNLGSVKVSNERLAVMNNIVIPIAIINSFLFFQEEINFMTFFPAMILFYFSYRLT
ncbi:MAG: DMT family transporter [Pelagibacteraceae bacterium]